MPKGNRGAPARTSAAPARSSNPPKKSGAPRKFGAAKRTGAPARGGNRFDPRAGGDRSRPAEKGLGGEQVEGRQAVRELLIAGRRKTREIWIANDIDANDVIDDIRELAEAVRVTVTDVPRKHIENTARSEAPQGIIAFAAPLPEIGIEEL